MLLHDEAHNTWKWFDGWHAEPTPVMPFVFIGFIWFAWAWDPGAVTGTLAMLVAFSPIWLPVFLAIILFITWVHYIRYAFWFKREFAVLQIQLPAEVAKSPLGIEIFLSSIWTTGGETTFLDRVWKGKFKMIWSLEIASNEGQINYYIHTPRIWKPVVEGRLYGQYPEIQITEVDDYVRKVPFNMKEYEIWGAEYMKRDPQAMPFKTYVDFELDKDTDTPETKNDPLVNLLEVMNTMGKDEYLWFQIIIKAHSKFDWYGVYESESRFIKDGKKKIQQLMVGAAERAGSVLKDSDIVDGKMNALLTEGERELIKGMEHSFTKNPTEVGMRIVYIAKKDKFRGINGAFLFRIFQVFNNPYGNGIGGTRGMIRFDYPWEDFMGIREKVIKRLLHFHYKYRAYFYVPHDQTPSIMTAEEIATLWHFPWSNVKTPGLNRVPTRSSEAPTNLPTLPNLPE